MSESASKFNPITKNIQRLMSGHTRWLYEFVMYWILALIAQILNGALSSITDNSQLKESWFLIDLLSNPSHQDIPKYERGKPCGWILKVEKYFMNYHTPEVLQVEKDYGHVLGSRFPLTVYLD